MTKKFNLQFFAVGVNENNETPPAQSTDPKPVDEKITFNEAQQKHIDILISQVTAKERAKAEKELAEARDKEKQVAELAAITDEKERKLKEYELKESEWEQERAAFKREQAISNAKDVLASKGLPIAMAELLVGENAEDTARKIEVYEKTHREGVNASVNEKLRGQNPQLGPVTKPVDLEKMSDEEYVKWRLAKNK